MINLDTLENYECIFEELYSSNSNNNYNCILKENEIEQNILLQTPRFQLQSNIPSGYIVLGCNTILKKSENFINLIKRLEVEFGEYIKKKLKKKKYKLYSGFIDSTREVKYIFKLYNGKDVILFDENKNRVDSVNVKLYSDIILIIKLRNLWINNEKKLYGINWDIEQGRIFPEIDYNKCLIYDRELKKGYGNEEYGLEIAKSLDMDSTFLGDAIKIRNYIVDETEYKQSIYNSDKFLGKCEICNDTADDIHHIKFQSSADTNGYIGNMHKNKKCNLCALCSSCHTKVHNNTIYIDGYIHSSNGITLKYSI